MDDADNVGRETYMRCQAQITQNYAHLKTHICFEKKTAINLKVLFTIQYTSRQYICTVLAHS